MKVFAVAVERASQNEAIGIAIPAICDLGVGCYSAADTESDILSNARQAASLALHELIEAQGSKVLLSLNDKGIDHYKGSGDYNEFNEWMLLELDLAPFLGPQQRYNVSLNSGLVAAIDQAVELGKVKQRSRSAFLEQAALNALKL